MARTLARQFLGWQLGIVGLLLVAVTALAVVQSNAAFRETQGRRMLSVAEDVAATAGVRASLAARDYGPLPALGTSARNLSGADEIVIALARQVCLRRGGSITLHNDGGAVFTACLPPQPAAVSV